MGRQVDRALFIEDVAGNKIDPAFEAHVQPIAAFATALWDGWVDREHLQNAIVLAVRKLASAQGTNWQSVTGPITATVATMHRLKWHFITPTKVQTDEERILDLTRDPPHRRHTVRRTCGTQMVPSKSHQSAA